MGTVGEWGIDIFRLSELANDRPLTVVGYTLFKVPSIILYTMPAGYMY